jgi:hypothetical protein
MLHWLGDTKDTVSLLALKDLVGVHMQLHY